MNSWRHGTRALSLMQAKKVALSLQRVRLVGRLQRQQVGGAQRQSFAVWEMWVCTVRQQYASQIHPPPHATSTHCARGHAQPRTGIRRCFSMTAPSSLNRRVMPPWLRSTTGERGGGGAGGERGAEPSTGKSDAGLHKPRSVAPKVERLAACHAPNPARSPGLACQSRTGRACDMEGSLTMTSASTCASSITSLPSPAGRERARAGAHQGQALATGRPRVRIAPPAAVGRVLTCHAKVNQVNQVDPPAGSVV